MAPELRPRDRAPGGPRRRRRLAGDLSLGERRGSLMAGLLASHSRQEPCEEMAEEVAELPLTVRWESGPDRRRDRRGWGRRRRQARGGAVCREAVGMRNLQGFRSVVIGTTRPVHA